MNRAYLSLGSNLGDRAGYLGRGVVAVAGADPYRVSSLYETAPVSDVAQPDFLNLVVELTTDATPRELLSRARAAEAAALRTRDVPHGPRTLDVDVLLVGDDVSDDPEITVPHPRMYERRFVLVPLAELAPALVPPAVLAAATGTVRLVGTLPSLR